MGAVVVVQLGVLMVLARQPMERR
jgi:hypothetical protein